MNPTANIKGIIYRMYNSSAADKVLYIIDHDGEKNIVIAKGVKKQNSKKAHSIDLCNYVNAKTVGGYNLPILTDIKLTDDFPHWKNDYRKIFYLHLFCEVIDKFCYEENKDAALFKILYNTLKQKTERVAYLASIFLLQILQTSGNLPELSRSIVSSDILASDSIYTLADNIGYVREDETQYGAKITDRIYKTQRFAVSAKISEALRVQLTADEEHELLKLHLGWIEQIIDQLKSKELILNITL